MKEEREEYKKAIKTIGTNAIIGSNRMEMGLPCFPHKIRGDMDEVKRLNAEILKYKELLSRSATAIEMYKKLIDRAEQYANGVKYDSEHISIPHCQFESDIGICKCSKPVSRISFGLPCCEKHAIERDKSLK